MKTLLLNSAVLPGPGEYRYDLISRDEVVNLLRERPGESRIGYPETARHIEAISGLRVPLSRERSEMAPGDEAIVVRVKYRIPDPATKGSLCPKDGDWEYGLLARKA